MNIAFFIISFFPSLIGAVCGVGGGVIIKPLLDLFGLTDIASANFLSGCTVLAMSSYNVMKEIRSGENQVDISKMTSLAIGAGLGGVFGKQVFSATKNIASNPINIGKIQALCLLIVTLGTMLYMIFREHIQAKNIKGHLPCIFIGMILGMMSSFLGIGGGPINLVVFHFFFSMDTKVAAKNSLYTIFFSQLTSLVTTIVTQKVPDFDPKTLVVMVIGGIVGGIIGRICNTKISETMVSRLFVSLLGVIIAICAYNMLR